MNATEARAVVAGIVDPEIPVLTIEDLGILREVVVEDDQHVVVTITPTYSGCPAMDQIRAEITGRLGEHGVDDAEVQTVLSPAWSTDWMSDEGRRKLRQYGIAPPGSTSEDTVGVSCPRCGSANVREISRFGATSCQAQYACQACLEPFDHFKTH